MRKKSEETPDKGSFRNDSDDECANIDSSSKAECKNLRDRNEL